MKTRHILTIFALSFVFGSCSNYEETDVIPESLQTESIIGILNPLSRTSLDLSRNVVWNSGDRIRIFGESVPAGAVYTTTSDNTRTGIFLPEEEQSVVNDAVRYAVYPADAASGTLAATSLEVDFSALAEQSYYSALGGGTGISTLPMIARSEDKAFSFQNLCGGVLLQLNDYQSLGIKIKTVVMTAADGKQIAGTASVDLESGAIALGSDGDHSSVTVNCGDGANISSGGDLSKNAGFILFLPAATYDGLEFVLTDTEGRCYEIATRQSVTVTAGVVTPLQALPLTIYYGSSNCYWTSGAGSVEIDVTPYYTFSEKFEHENLKCLNESGAVAGLPTQARIVWQQAATDESGDVISTPTLDHATLRVPTTGKKGNAVVAVCDSEGTILWSYHIWVSEAEDIAWKNEALGNFHMLDRNLGATSTTQKDPNAYGLFYQWGRKDPLARNLAAARPTGNPYESETSSLEQTLEATAETGTIAYAIQHPDTRLLAATDWLVAGRIHGLWGNANGTIEEGTGVKTIFDPCPAGYRVPEELAYAGLTDKDKGNCNDQYGHMFDVDGAGTTSYFPTAGYLEKNKDVIKYLEYRGYLWTNVPGETGAYYFYYNNANLNRAGLDRAAGCPIRCIKIE